MRIRTSLVLAAIVAATFAREALPSIETPLPNITLVTQDNRKVLFYDDLVKGKVVLINFMFATCKGSCPQTVSNLAKVQAALGDRLGRDVFMYSITLDPGHDTPEVLKGYAEAFGAKPGWTFLTGKRRDIDKLRHKLGVADPDPAIDKDRTQHSGIVVYGNDALDRWAAMPGMLSPQRIADSILRVMQ